MIQNQIFNVVTNSTVEITEMCPNSRWIGLDLLLKKHSFPQELLVSQNLSLLEKNG